VVKRITVKSVDQKLHLGYNVCIVNKKEKQMKYTNSQITNYAIDYLSGSNLVPIGVLDSAEFKAEVRRLWGPEPSPAEQATHQKALAKKVAKFEQALNKLRGPKGGIPKVGRRDFLYNLKMLEAMKAELV
jgi:predicted Zn-dependent protease